MDVRTRREACAPHSGDEADERRLPEGWYIAPGMVLGLVFWGFAIYGLLDLLNIVKD